MSSLLELRGSVELEHEVIMQVQRSDVWFIPDPPRAHDHGEELGVVDRMFAQGTCSISDRPWQTSRPDNQEHPLTPERPSTPAL